jgi:hypothetical protein
MKRLSWRLGLVAACAVLAFFGRATSVFAAEPERGGAGDRLDRLEQRLDEVIQHQEQQMRRLGAQQEGQGQQGMAGRDNMRPMTPQRDGARMGQPMTPPGAPAWAGIHAPAGQPAGAGKDHEGLFGLLRLFLLVAFVFNILIAIWIFTDIRKRGEGSGIFIVLALLAGIPAAIIYALVRIGDKRP